MAERRMFAKSIIDSDFFLDMPQSTQLLYFHLSMRADDDGFINNPKSIMRNVKCNEDDLKLLTAKQFIIPFESGVVVIKHWRIHNYIKSDRYKSTIYQEEKSCLSLENNTYIMSGTTMEPERIQDGTIMEPEWNHVGTEVDTQVRDIVRDKKSKSIDKDTYCTEPENFASVPAAVIELILNDKSFYPITQQDIDEWQELYPNVNILQELRKMKGWLDANPTKRKTSRGIKRFINSWLSREQDRYKGDGKIYGEKNNEIESTSSVRLW